jgi:Family of unknown function (DUF5335)
MQPARAIDAEQWSEYFDWLSKELLNAPVRIEIVEASGPPRVQAKDLALQTLAYDRRSDVFEVAAAHGGPRLPATLRHLVDHPQQVLVDSEVLLAPIEIAVDGRDGVRTLIKVARQAEFAG